MPLRRNSFENTPVFHTAENIFKPYLITGEQIHWCYELSQGNLAVTDRRILLLDSPAGKLETLHFLYLESIYNLEITKDPLDLQDAELRIFFVSSPYLQYQSPECSSWNLTFSPQHDVQKLYRFLLDQAYSNFKRINL